MTALMAIDPARTPDHLLALAVIGREDGASAAESELCRRFAPRVRAYGLRHLRDHDLAGELVQRVLLLTLEKLRAGAIRDPTRIASFVLGAARNLALTLRRESVREAPVAAPEPPPHLAAADPVPLADDALARCLEGLSERARSVVTLTYYLERSPDEIAASLGLAQGHVRVIRHRALAALRACMGAKESERGER